MRCFFLFFFLLQIIFRFALALFKYQEEEFLKLQDTTAIFKYLRYFTRTILDSRSGHFDNRKVLHCSEQCFSSSKDGNDNPDILYVHKQKKRYTMIIFLSVQH